MEEALIEMCLAGVSVRRVEDITEALWGSKVASATPVIAPVCDRFIDHIRFAKELNLLGANR